MPARDRVGERTLILQILTLSIAYVIYFLYLRGHRHCLRQSHLTRVRQIGATDAARRYGAHYRLRFPHAKRYAGFFGDPIPAEKQ